MRLGKYGCVFFNRRLYTHTHRGTRIYTVKTIRRLCYILVQQVIVAWSQLLPSQPTLCIIAARERWGGGGEVGFTLVSSPSSGTNTARSHRAESRERGCKPFVTSARRRAFRGRRQTRVCPPPLIAPDRARVYMHKTPTLSTPFSYYIYTHATSVNTRIYLLFFFCSLNNQFDLIFSLAPLARDTCSLSLSLSLIREPSKIFHRAATKTQKFKLAMKSALRIVRVYIALTF